MRDLDSLLSFLAYNIVKNNCGLWIVQEFCFWCEAILSKLVNLKFKSDLNKNKRFIQS